MHREISHADRNFAPESHLSLYLLTGLLGLLIGLDLWPAFAAWMSERGLALPGTWPREFAGYRLALLAAILGGARVLYGSLESLFEGRIGADLALAIACIAAILFNKPLVAAEVVFIGMLGECLESFTFERTQRAIRRIVEVFPRRCWLLRDGQEVRVLTHELAVGDKVIVKPGARVPVDGVVVEGRSALDVSALTGESLPVDAEPGNEVLAGSLNQFGALTIEARRVAEHTVVGRVIELTARALRDKSSMERTADRMARYFLPVVLALAAVTFFGGVLLNLRSARTLAEAARASIDPTLAVLVVACPCALILATPAAIIAALGRLAGTGVLIKGGSALERLAEVSAFAFDKTGTLTEGRLELGDLVCFHGTTTEELLRVAATAEQRSEHPLARLILHEAAARSLALASLDDFQAQPGAGITAASVGDALIVGTRRLLEEKGVGLSSEVLASLDQLDSSGQTPLLVARNGVVLGIVGARDRVRPEAVVVLGELRSLAIGPLALLTGDRPAAAQAVAATLNLDEVRAELLPADKAEFLNRWQSDGPAGKRRKVAMVGDGINDAPALARADVGLAIGGTGTDVAAEAGDVVLMGDPLRTLPLLVRLSRETVRIIHQNIVVFAFGVNAVGIVCTAWLWPFFAPPAWLEEAPIAAVIYHQFGSLAVLLNSMRLLWFERRQAHPGWQKTKDRFQALDAWMAHYLNADEILHWLSHQWKPVLASLLLLAVAAYGLSGLTQVGPDEVAVVRRFGRPLEADLKPGLHWCWPWPIEEITRLQPERIHLVTVGFRAASRGADAIPLAGSGAWSTEHRGLIKLVPDEAVMITGDGNMVELQASVRYTIREPRVYLFEVREPEELIRAVAESVLREAVAGRPFIELLTVDRGRFQQEVVARLAERFRIYGEHGVGIAIDGLSLPDVHPPQEVVQAYHEVAKAMENRDRLKNEALAGAVQQERRSEAEALKTVRGAEADRNEKVLSARAEHDAFTAWLETRRYQAVLTDFRLFWDALGKALSGREKLIVDADKVPGRRQLLLFDPDKFKIPVPVMIPDRGAPARRGINEDEGP